MNTGDWLGAALVWLAAQIPVGILAAKLMRRRARHDLMAVADATREPRPAPASGAPLTAMPPAATLPRPPAPPAGVTIHVPPCGCVYYHTRTQCDPCPAHAAQAAERAEINRLDHQIRNMP